MKKALLLLTFLVLNLGMNLDAQAASKKLKPRLDDRTQQVSCRVMSKGSAMRIAAGQSGDKVLSAYLSNGRSPVYRVKVISKSGRVRTVQVNACS